MKPLSPNTMIQNRYLVVHLIGKGGMGEVYLAVDQRLGSAVALKRTSFADDAGLAAAFEREAKILARLRHPVLPKVSDHFAENGDQFLVMEHISGDDLSKRLESANKAFPVSWVMFWADQLLDALSYLHSHEPPIIHRDIKPQNLKLTDENHIVLLDFGLSKDTANQSVISAPGTSGSVVGYTPHFAPMEQIRGTGTNPRSDIYSLSATLYQLMTNVVPADALSRADVMLNGQADPIRPLSELNPEISPAVSSVILKGLEVSQDKRFGSAAEMQKALRAAYAQIQTAMAADTVVINAGDITSDVHLTSPPIDTNAPVAPSEMATVTNSQPFVSPVVASPEEVEPIAEAPALEETIQMDRADAIEEIRQADVKTEVFLGVDSPVAAAVPPSPFTEPDKSPADELSPTPAFEPAATVPLIDVNEAIAAAEPPTPEFFDSPAAVASPLPPDPAVAAIAESTPAPKKRSKAGLVIGGLIGLLFLGAIAAGAAWFIYNNFMAPANVSPTPSPSPAASATPAATPSPTPESSPTASPESNSNSGSNSGMTVSPTPEPTTGATPVTRPTPQTGPVKTPPVGPAKTPAAKPPVTPKAKPNNDRTVIDQ